jgi:zinc protease
MNVALVRTPARAAGVQEITSAGGLRAWLVEDYTIPIVTLQVAFDGGSAQDPTERTGVAHAAAALLDEGAGDLDSRAFQARLEDLSINLSFDAGRDHLFGSLRTLKARVGEAFDLFRLAVTAPRFDTEPLERIRGQVLAKLRRDQTQPGEISIRRFGETTFGGHPYGRSTIGTLESVPTITADDLRAFHRNVVARSGLHAVFVGAISAADAAEALDALFGELPAAAQLAEIGEIMPALGRQVHATLNVPQSTIRVGGLGVKRDDPDFIPAFMANHILGGGTFSSRLYKAVREERGLAYSVGSGLILLAHAGAMAAATSVDAANQASTVGIILDEIHRFAKDGPTEAELASAKDFLVGNFALRFDSSQSIARNLLQFQLDRLGIDYVEKRNALIRAVTLEEVAQVAARLWSGAFSVVTVGPGES